MDELIKSNQIGWSNKYIDNLRNTLTELSKERFSNKSKLFFDNLKTITRYNVNKREGQIIDKVKLHDKIVEG